MLIGADEVTICNMAIGNCGVSETIESIDPPEDSTASVQCSIWYHIARQQTLEVQDWDFARKRKALTAHGVAPPTNWAYRYKLPPDCIKPRYLENPAGLDADAVPFTTETVNDNELTLLCNLSVATLVYTFNSTVVSMFSPMFAVTHSYLLAHHIAFALTGNKQTKQQMLQGFQGWARSAAGSNAQVGVPLAPRDADTIRARE